MRMPALAATFGALSLSACASSGDRVALVETGYERGALGVNAIARADWDKAETLLTEKRGVSESDPARLINLGRVYMETGRPGLALSAWRLALASGDHFMVETGDGRVVSTEVLAREALARYEAEVRTASR